LPEPCPHCRVPPAIADDEKLSLDFLGHGAFLPLSQGAMANQNPQ